MKKIYLLGIALGLVLAANAQTTVISEDFESRNLGSLHSTPWDNWLQLGPNASLDMIVSSNRASSGTKSGFVGPQNDDKGQDALLKMPSVYTQGKVTAEWKMFVPTDSVAYYNLQEQAISGGSYAFQCYINTYAADDTLTNGTSLQHKLVWTFSINDTAYLYAYAPLANDQWFTLKQVMNLDSAKLNLYVDGTEVTYFQPTWGNDWPGEKKSVASFDFFSYADTENPDQTNTYYIDDVLVTVEGVTGINNVDKDSKLISVYPNPCKGYINLSAKDQTITNVEVFNVLGQKVLSSNAKTTVATLNTHGLASGTYTAKVTTKDGMFTKQFVVK